MIAGRLLSRGNKMSVTNAKSQKIFHEKDPISNLPLQNSTLPHQVVITSANVHGFAYISVDKINSQMKMKTFQVQIVLPTLVNLS